MAGNYLHKTKAMKHLCLVAAGLLVMTTLAAQRTRTTTEFGIKGGVNIANLKIDGAGDGDSRTGFHLGGLAHIHVAPKFAIQPEIMFSTQGRRETIAGNEFQTNLSYINIPVLGQYMTGSGFRLQTGPQLGILVDAQAEVNDDAETDVGDNYKTPDISWVFGVSYLTNVRIGFDARYNLGLSNINDAGSREFKNRVWQFGVFYQFPHK